MIQRIEHGITSSAKMPGRSTVEGVLAYAGQPVRQLRHGKPHDVVGWQGLSFKRLRHLGMRLVADTDVPDLALFAEHYGSHTVSVRADPSTCMCTIRWLPR